MKRVIGLLIFVLAHAVAASPAIIGSARDARCREALFLADAAFRSRSGSLLWPIARPPPRSSKIVLRQNARDISGGHALEADSAAFSTLAPASASASAPITFWAVRASGGRRLVVTDNPFNWRGDWYYVFLVSADMTPDRFASERNSEHSALKPLLGDNRWIPPLVLQEASSRDYWLIDRGEPYQVMPDWTVYVPDKDRLTSPCHVSFGYSAANSVDQRLAAVRKLAAELDEALGPGSEDDRLQQTTAIRGEVAKEWANASVRPWALTDEPYNSRIEVEHGLAEWARGSAKRTALLRRINLVYPQAERELASYYAVQFDYRASSAKRLSRTAIDHMFRSYFVFSKSRLPATM